MGPNALEFWNKWKDEVFAIAKHALQPMPSEEKASCEGKIVEIEGKRYKLIEDK
jgi:hypothetical protein